MSDHTITTTDAAATPRTRWAAILWGVVLAAIAAGALSLVLSPDGPARFADWLVGLTPLSVVAYAVVAIGGLLLIAGVAGSLAARSAASHPVVERAKRDERESRRHPLGTRRPPIYAGGDRLGVPAR